MGTQAEQAAKQGHAQILWLEDAEQSAPETGIGTTLGGALEGFGLGDGAAHIEDQQGWQQAEGEHHPPGVVLRQDTVDQGEQQHRTGPAHGPGALHRRHDLAAVFGANGLGHEHGARRPFTADAKALQGLDRQQRVIAIDKGRQGGEAGEPEDGPLQDPYPTEAIRQAAGEPATHGRGDQGDPGDEAGIGLGHRQGHQQCRNGQAEHLDLQGIHRPAAKAGPEGFALAARDVFVPVEHDEGASCFWSGS